MMAVFLADDDIIDGEPRRAGELVTVPDDYDPDNIRSIVRRNLEQFHRQEQTDRRQRAESKKDTRSKEKQFQAALAKLKAILQADYPQFWNKLSNRPALLAKIIEEMRADVSILQHALSDPKWFVDTVTKRFTNNAGRSA